MSAKRKREIARIKSEARCDRGAVMACIRFATIVHHQPYGDAVRVCRCESGFDPFNEYAGHYGLFQFLGSTFATTPYRNKNIWSPKWNSLAAMWMWKVGRRGEWACQ